MALPENESAPESESEAPRYRPRYEVDSTKLRQTLPEEIASRPRFLLWIATYDPQRDKWTKVPRRARAPLVLGSSTNPAAWSDLDTALDALPFSGCDGLGHALGDGIGGVDLDRCFDEAGDLRPWAAEIVEAFDTYTEFSPSGDGLHLLCASRGDRGRARPTGDGGKIEAYQAGRYFTVTGALYEGRDRLRDCQKLLDDLLDRLDPAQGGERPVARLGAADLSADLPRDRFDALLVNAPAAAELFERDQPDDDPSARDFALVCTVARLGWSRAEAAAVVVERRARAGDPKKKAERPDYIGRTVEAAFARVEAEARRVEDPPEPAGERPEIVVRTGDAPPVEDLERILLDAGAQVFQRNRRLVTISRAVEARRSAIRRPVGACYIDELTRARLWELASRFARWTREKPNALAGTVRVAIEPKREILDALLDRGEYRFPPLSGIVTAPTLRPDGSILDEPGYDDETGLFLVAADEFPPIPTRPTRDAAVAALAELSEPFDEFPAVAPSDRSALVALVLTIAARHAIVGYVPGFAVDAPAAGTGKSLAVDAAAMIATGRPASRWIESHNPEEDRKRLHAVAMAGDPVLLLDNLEKSLRSGALANAMTAPSISDRLLGTPLVVDAPFYAVVALTGNNLEIAGDLRRRFLQPRLDAQAERPEERSGFRRDPLLAWVAQERPRLLVAALTILRAFDVAGRPAQGGDRLGGFEAWSDLIRAAILWSGGSDPCETRERLRTEEDPDVAPLGRLLAAWRMELGDQPATAADVLGIAGGELAEAARAFTPPDRRTGEPGGPILLGNALAKVRDRVVGRLRLRTLGLNRAKVRVWRVEEV